MSVRAYRASSNKIEKASSFNLWHDWRLKDFLDQEADFYSFLNLQGMGTAVVPLNVLQKAVKKAAELEIDEDTVDILKRDIAAEKSKNEDSVDYYCY